MARVEFDIVGAAMDAARTLDVYGIVAAQSEEGHFAWNSWLDPQGVGIKGIPSYKVLDDCKEILREVILTKRSTPKGGMAIFRYPGSEDFFGAVVFIGGDPDENRFACVSGVHAVGFHLDFTLEETVKVLADRGELLF